MPLGEPWQDTPVIDHTEVTCVKCGKAPAEYTGYRTRFYFHGLAQCHGEQAQFAISAKQNARRLKAGVKIELFGGTVLPAWAEEDPQELPAPKKRKTRALPGGWPNFRLKG